MEYSSESYDCSSLARCYLSVLGKGDMNMGLFRFLLQSDVDR